MDGNEKKYNDRWKDFIWQVLQYLSYCNTYNNTIIKSINKILKYFNIFSWKIYYSSLGKLTVQINGPTIYFFWGYESWLQKKTTKILRRLDAGEKMLTKLEMLPNISEKLWFLLRECLLFQSTYISKFSVKMKFEM